jgi:hypothetical protein
LLNEEEDLRRGMRIAGQVMVGILAERDYGGLETMTSGRHLSADEIRRAVEAIGQPIVRTPEWEWPHVSVSPSTRKGPAGFDFVAPLWTTDGRSGLGLAVHLIPTTYGTFEVEIEGFVPLDAGAVPDVRREPAPIVRTGDASGGSGRPSDSPVPERWQPVLGSIIHRLVIGDYAGLAADGLVSYTSDPTDTRIGRWIEDYPAHLVDLPAEAWAYSEHGPRVGVPQSWWVIVDLWTAEEGRGDLSMEATVWDDGSSVVAKVDNVHVM